MKQIYLSGKNGEGKSTMVDDEDFPELNKYKWFLMKTGYVMGYRSNSQKKIYIARLIKNKHPELEVDHIDGDKLNNKKSNLRYCTRQQNAMNLPMQKHNTSGYKGVCFVNKNRKYLAQLKINGKRIYLGEYVTKEDAALAYNNAAKEYFGEFARLNIL